MANKPDWQKYDPSASGLIPEGRGSWRKFSDYVKSDPMGFLGSKREDRWRPGKVPPRRAVRNMANQMLVSHGSDKERENAAHELHAGEVARTVAAGETTAVQGANTTPSGSGGTPADAPPPPLQSGDRRGAPGPGASLQELTTQDPYRSRMRAVRGPGGNIVFTNDLGAYGGEEAEMVPYEEAISGMGGEFMGRETTPGVSSPITADGTAYVHDRPGSGAVAPVALENRPPMSDQDITERGATMAAAEGPNDTRSILERRAWTERRLAEQRRQEMEEAAVGKAEMEAGVDPRELAQIEQAGRWGSEQLEQTAEAERSAKLAGIVQQYEALIGMAIERGDTEAANHYREVVRMLQRSYGRSVPEPRAPGMEALFGSVIGDEVDEKLEEKKARK